MHWLTALVIRTAAEAAVGFIIATATTMAVMITMFHYGPWANPPGINELGISLTALAGVVVTWRTVGRVRTRMHPKL